FTFTPSANFFPAYTSDNNQNPFKVRKLFSATCRSFQIIAVAFWTFLKRLAPSSRRNRHFCPMQSASAKSHGGSMGKSAYQARLRFYDNDENDKVILDWL